MKRNEFFAIREYYMDIHLENIQRRMDTQTGTISQIKEKIDELQAEYDEVSKEKEKYSIVSYL